MKGIARILRPIRNALFNGFNREFLIFLFFLGLSSAYWLMSVLNDTMEKDFYVPVRLVNIPRNVIIINDSNYTAHVILRDKGYTLAAYYFGNSLKPIEANFNSYVISRDKVVLPASEIQGILSDMLFKSTKIVAIKTDRITYTYNYGQHKRVPVRLAGTVTPHDSYYLARTLFSPDSVDVYANSSKLDSIHEVYTTRVNIQELRDTISQEIKLRRIPGTKIVPSSVKMTLIPDVMIEMRTTVPIKGINIPEGKRLRTFPTNIEVRYVIGAAQYHDIDSTAFLVIADYKRTNGGTVEKCPLRIIRAPRMARNPRLSEPSVRYLLEQ